MPTIAADTDLIDSTLPPGGRPAWDDEFMAWARAFVFEANLAGLLLTHPEWFGANVRAALARRVVGECELRIANPILNEWRLLGHLFRWLNGEAAFPKGVKSQHRLRFLAIRFHFQPDLIRAEADRYFEALMRPEP